MLWTQMGTFGQLMKFMKKPPKFEWTFPVFTCLTVHLSPGQSAICDRKTQPHSSLRFSHLTQANIRGKWDGIVSLSRPFSWLDFHFVVNKFIKRIPCPCFQPRASFPSGWPHQTHFQVRNYRATKEKNLKNRQGVCSNNEKKGVKCGATEPGTSEPFPNIIQVLSHFCPSLHENGLAKQTTQKMAKRRQTKNGDSGDNIHTPKKAPQKMWEHTGKKK